MKQALQTAEMATRNEFRFLGQTLSWLRWTILAAMLAITLIWPVPGRTRHSVWVFVTCLCMYNLVVEVLRYQIPRLQSFAWISIVDLCVAGTFYFLDYEPGGPLFVYFYVALITAAVTLSLRSTVMYTMAVLVVIALVAPTLPGWSAEPMELRQLTARLIVLSLVGVGTSLLTRRLAVEQELRRQVRVEAERLEELERLRNDFIASISHDLRTPLTAVRAGLGMLETVAHDRRDARETNLLANVRRNIDRLNLLIDDLLTLNQLNAGVLELDRVPLDLRIVVTNAISVVHTLLQEKQQIIELDLPQPLPVAVDRRRIEQVVVNLLANAHQHTPPGTRVELVGKIVGNEVRLTVRDTGPGIPSAELEEIFERFHRMSTSRGSGLGLAIVRSIVELHGGRVWAESRAGGGASFHATFPRVEVTPDMLGIIGQADDPQYQDLQELRRSLASSTNASGPV